LLAKRHGAVIFFSILNCLLGRGGLDRRYQTNGKRVNAEKREMEALLKRSDVKRALHRDAHPGASPTQLLTHDQEFIKLTAILDRIERSP
jgi:hypothetical protein